MEQGASSGAKSKSKDKEKVAWSQEQEGMEGAISGETSKRKEQGIRKRIKEQQLGAKSKSKKIKTAKALSLCPSIPFH
jgi:hypothetical protein